MQEIAQLWTDATGLSTAHIADGCVRAGLQVRCGPAAVTAVSDRAPRLAGRCLPVRHFGSVDVFLEAIERSHPGDVLIVDNQGRTDESCVGDLVALEAKAAGLSGIAIWGLHRDTRDLRDIGLPVFSLGALPAGPKRLDERRRNTFSSAEFGEHTIRTRDTAFGDEDGLIFVQEDRANEVLMHALQIRDVERSQASRIRLGTTLRDQVHFSAYVQARRSDPQLTLREHLRRVGGTVEV
ncbi:RraA family protein [Pseudoclavibacter helvolus]|uniref:RraA family protein n=1 Tax=Pseudoclavibacter helvolus TaxID=255205 RepID=UPI000A8621B4|nr:RraA family protein [Pseudoclavibacter helvolus]